MPGPVEHAVLVRVTSLTFLAGVVLAILGVVLIIFGDHGASELSLFGAQIKTGSIGVAAIFIGAVLIILNTRALLKALVVVQDADHMKAESRIARTRLYKYAEKIYEEDLEKERQR